MSLVAGDMARRRYPPQVPLRVCGLLQTRVMQVAIIHESLTGNTERAAWLMGDAFWRRGISTRLFPITEIDEAVVAAADMVIVGSWTDGLLIVGQRPGRGGRLKKLLPPLDGKRAAVYCTYAIAPGGTLKKLQKRVEGHGGQVVGGLAIRRDDLEAGAESFVAQLAGHLSPTR